MPAEFELLSAPQSRYNCFMPLAIILMRSIEVMFFIGLMGSAIVVLISFIEDAKELGGKD